MSPSPVKITRRETRAVLFYALAIVALTTAPYLLALANQGPDWVFSGFLIGAEDGTSYLGKMRLGARGLWDFYLFYTAEPHAAAPLVYLLYILPGQLVRLFVPVDSPALTGTLLFVYHAMRVVFDILFILILYRFIAVFLRAPAARMLALLLATLGGGIGWLLTLVGQTHLLGTLPPEYYIPEGFSFIILFSLPHLGLARAALLGGFLALFSTSDSIPENSIALPGNSPSLPLSTQWRGGRGVRLTLAALCWLIVGLAVPFYFVIIYALVSGWLLTVWLRQRAFPVALFLRCAVAVAITLPLFAYFTFVISTNPAFAQWSAQNLLPSPHPLHYLLAYGVWAAFAVIGGRRVWQRGDQRGLLLLAWVVIVPFLVYLPIPVQRRMAEAVIVPLSILAVLGIRLLVRWWTRWRRASGHRRSWRRARNLALAAAIPSSLFLLLGSTLTALHQDRPLYIPAAEVTALDWLNTHAEPDAVVLSSKAVGNLVPMFTSLRVYVGHGPETLGAISKEALVARFYRDELSADERRALFESMRIRYVFYGAAERELAGEDRGEPAWQGGLALVYDDGSIQIFAVGQ
jgi:hypothetical protein